MGPTFIISQFIRLDQYPPVPFNNWCNKTDVAKDGTSAYDIHFPGNFSSDAEFFVFTGVISWLFCFLRFVFQNYLFHRYHHHVQPRRLPLLQLALRGRAEELPQGPDTCPISVLHLTPVLYLSST